MNISSEVLSKRVRSSKDVVFQEVSGEIVILDLNSERYFGLNEVGAAAWTHFQAGKTVDEVIEAILAEYEVDRSQAEVDVGQLFSELTEAGLLTEVQD